MLGEHRDLARLQPVAAPADLKDRAHHRAGDARADDREADGALIADQHGQPARVGLYPGMRDAQREHPLDALGRAQGGEKPRPSTPVVTDPGGALDRQGIQHAEHVGRELLLLIASRWRLAPAVAAQVGGDDPEALGQVRDDVVPAPPVLGPAMNKEQGRRLGWARQRDVHMHPAGVYALVYDARQVRRLAHLTGAYSGRAQVAMRSPWLRALRFQCVASRSRPWQTHVGETICNKLREAGPRSEVADKSGPQQLSGTSSVRLWAGRSLVRMEIGPCPVSALEGSKGREGLSD